MAASLRRLPIFWAQRYDQDRRTHVCELADVPVYGTRTQRALARDALWRNGPVIRPPGSRVGSP